MRRSVVAALVAGAALVGGSADAAIVSYSFTAELTDAAAIGVDVNSLSTRTVTGTYSVDTTIAAAGTSTANQAAFPALTAFSLSYDGNSVTGTPAASEIQQDDAFLGFPDRYAVLGRGLTPTASIGDFTLLFAGFVLRDLDNTVISDARNLLTNPNLSDFEQADFLAFFTDDSTPEFDLLLVSGVLTSLRQIVGTDVPAPAALLLLGTALAMLGAVRRKPA